MFARYGDSDPVPANPPEDSEDEIHKYAVETFHSHKNYWKSRGFSQLWIGLKACKKRHSHMWTSFTCKFIPSHCQIWWPCQQLWGWSQDHQLVCSGGRGTPLDQQQTFSSAWKIVNCTIKQPTLTVIQWQFVLTNKLLLTFSSRSA